MEEKRLHPRLTLPLEVELVAEGASHRATMENLSAGGAGVTVPEGIKVGTALEKFEFTLPAHGEASEYTISTRAEVVRSERIGEEGSNGDYDIGVRFLDTPEEQFRKIQQYIYQDLTKGRPQPSEMPLERRRINVERPISIRFDRFDEFVNEVSGNISLGGMFVRTNDPKPPGTILLFQFQLGDDFSLVEGRAEVVWIRKKRLGVKHQAGMGVRFLDLDDSSRNVIMSLVKQAAAGKQIDEPVTGKFRVASVTSRTPLAGRGIVSKRAREAAAQPILTRSAGEATSSAASSDKVEVLRDELARRTRSYEKRVAELEERIADLTSRRVEKDEDLREKASAAGELQSLNTVLEQRLQELTTRLEHERKDLRGQLETANSHLADLRRELKTRQSENEAIRRKAAGSENRLLAVEQALRHTEKERDDFSGRLKASREEFKELQSQLEPVGSGGTQQVEDERRAELDEAANRLGSLEERLATAERDREEALGKLTLLTTTEGAVRQTAEEAESQRQELLAALEEARNNLAQVQGEHELQAAELRDESEQATAIAENERRRAEESETVRQELEEALALAQEESEQWRQRHQEVEAELRGEIERISAESEERIERLEADLEEAARRRPELEEALTRAEDELQQVSEERQELEGGFREEAIKAVAAAEDLEERIGTLQSSFDTSEQQRLELEETLATEQRALESLLGEREEAEKALREEADMADAIAEDRSRSLEMLEEALAENQRDQQELEQELARSKAEIEHLLEDREAVESELRTELGEAVASAAELREKVEGLQGSEGNLQRDLEEIRATELSVREELDQVREEGSGLQQELEQVRSAVLASESELKQARSEAADQLELAAGVEAELKEEIDSLRRTEKEAEESLAVARGEADELRGELEQVRAEAAEQHEQATGLERELREEVVTLRGAVRGLNRELEERGAEPVAGFGAFSEQSAEEARTGSKRNLRSAGLIGAGLLLGALVGGTGSRFWSGGASLEEDQTAVVEVAAESEDNRSSSDPGNEIAAIDPGQAEDGATEPGSSATAAPYPAASLIARAWAEAWSAQRVEDYLWFYSSEFVPPNGASRPAWEAFRKERVEAPESIEITLSEVREEPVDDERTRVVFEQAYTAGAYSDRVVKTLVMKREDDTWKIVSEQSEPLE